MDVTDRVLTIEEVKQKMKDIRAAAVHYGGVVHCGERGRDELVIVSSRKWEELTRSQATPAEVRESPYAVFDRALKEGRIGTQASGPEPRRRIQGITGESGLSVEEMIALGTDSGSPRRRRSE